MSSKQILSSLRASVGHCQAKPLNEIQYRLFTDFVCQWRFYINDHTPWQYSSASLAIGILRLAAWDLEVRTGGKFSGTDLIGYQLDKRTSLALGRPW